MGHKWIQKVTEGIHARGTEGAFRREARRRGLTTNRFMEEVLARPQKYSKLERQRANLANTFRKMRKRNT
jgi:hypothetical protein